jgi:hypothetical protein
MPSLPLFTPGHSLSMPSPVFVIPWHVGIRIDALLSTALPRLSGSLHSADECVRLEGLGARGCVDIIRKRTYE